MSKLSSVGTSIDRIKSLTLTQWLLLAAVFHLTLTLSIFLVGHFRLLPNQFDQNGIGVSYTADAVVYQKVTADLADSLRRRDLAGWYSPSVPIHCRIYSLSFVFPGSIVGYNILAAEVFNLTYYLGLLVVIYSLGKELFDSTAGFTAAVVIGFWPSYLLHSIQLIRDPLANLLMLGVMLILAILVGRTLSWKSSLWISVVSVAILIVVWLSRGNFWAVLVAPVGITSILLLVRVVRDRKLLLPNLFLLAVMAVAVLTVPTLIRSTTLGVKPPTSVIALPLGSNASSHSMLWRLGFQIRQRRLGFSIYEAKSSNMDPDVTFNTAWEIIRYIPRAAEIGFFAPFPRMWFDPGISGRSAKLLAALETVAMYVLYVPMVFCLLEERRRLSMWVIFLTTFVALLALGLVVPNAGALYRFRYLFWMMLIVLATRGILEAVARLSRRAYAP